MDKIKKSPLKHKGMHSPYVNEIEYHKAQGGVHDGVDYGKGTIYKSKSDEEKAKIDQNLKKFQEEEEEKRLKNQKKEEKERLENEKEEERPIVFDIDSTYVQPSDRLGTNVNYRELYPEQYTEEELQKIEKYQNSLLNPEDKPTNVTLEKEKDKFINLGYGSTTADHLNSEQNPDIPTILLTNDPESDLYFKKYKRSDNNAYVELSDLDEAGLYTYGSSAVEVPVLETEYPLIVNHLLTDANEEDKEYIEDIFSYDMLKGSYINMQDNPYLLNDGIILDAPKIDSPLTNDKGIYNNSDFLNLDHIPQTYYVQPSDRLGYDGYMYQNWKQQTEAQMLHNQTMGAVAGDFEKIYGTSDPMEILAIELGDDVFLDEWKGGRGSNPTNIFSYIHSQMSVKTIGPDGESGKHSMSNLDKKLITLPDFGSDAHNEYIYKWVKDDFGTEYNLEQGVGNLLNEIGIENNWYDEMPWTNPNSDYFKYLFFSEYVDREQIKELVNSKNAKKTQLENEIREGGLENNLKKVQDVVATYYTGADEDVYNLFKEGKWEDAVSLNEDRGIVTLYNQDGTYINWKDVPEEEKNPDNWKQKGFNSREEYAEHIANNVATMSERDNERAIVFAQEMGPAKLRELRYNKAFEVIEALKQLVEKEGINSVIYDRNLVGEIIDVASGSDHRSMDEAVLELIENNELVPNLRLLNQSTFYLGGGDQSYALYNKKFKELMVLSRALDLNMDPTLLAEEASNKVENIGDVGQNVYEFIVNPSTFAGLNNDEQVEVFEYIAESELGLEKTEDGKKLQREGSDWWGEGGVEVFGTEIDARDFFEGGRDFIGHIAPLIASVAATRKVSGKQINQVTNWIRNMMINANKTTKNSTAWRRVTDLVVGGINETIVLTGSDMFSEAIGADPFVLDMGKGGAEENINWEFAFGLGVGNTMAKKVIERIKLSRLGSRAFSQVDKIKTLDKLIGANIGAAAGVSSMEVAKIFSGDSEMLKYLFPEDIDYTLWEDGQAMIEMYGRTFDSEQEYRDYMQKMSDDSMYALIKQLGSDYIGMVGLNLISPGSGTLKALQTDLKNYKISKTRTSKATKTLSSDKKEITIDSEVKEIEEAASEKSKEIKDEYAKKEKELRDKFEKEYDKDASESTKKKNLEKLNNELKKLVEKRNNELKDINTAREDLLFSHDLKFIKELIEQDGKKWSEFEREMYVMEQKMLQNKVFKGQDYVDFAKMTDVQFEYFVTNMKAKHGQRFPQIESTLRAKREFFQEVVKQVAKEKLPNTKEGRKKRDELIEKTIELGLKKQQLNYLEKNNKDGINDAKIAMLKEELKGLDETYKNLLESTQAAFRKRVEQEMIIAKKIAEDLGADFEIAKNTEDYLAKAGKESIGTAGTYIRGTKGQKDKIIVDPEIATSARTLGTGIHEVVHYILRDALKEKYIVNGREKYRISKTGKAIIDKFLETLDPKDRKILDQRIKDDYAIEKSENIVDKFGNKIDIQVPKERYYEEYLTAYVEALKNKDIKLNKEQASKIQGIFMPFINKVFPNVGKKPIEKEYSVKDAESLKEMLESIYEASEKGITKWQMKDFMKRNPNLAVEAYKASSKVSREYMDKINKAAEGNYKELVEQFGKKKGGEIWNKEWKGRDSNPIEGRWFETFVEVAPDLKRVVLKKVSEFNRAAKDKIIDEQAFADRVITQMAGINENQLKTGGHMRNFDITEISKYEKEGTGFSGYLNNVYERRLWTTYKTASDLIQRERGLTEKMEAERGMDAFEMIESDISRKSSDRIQFESDKLKLHEAFANVNRGKGNQVKEIFEAIKNEFKNKDGTTNIEKLKEFTKDKNYKTLEGMMLAETVKVFTGGRLNKKGEPIHEKIAAKIKKKANLDQQDIQAVQPMLDKFMPTIFDFAIPQGFTTKEVKYVEDGVSKSMQVPGEATGIPRSIMAITHNKRSIAGETTAKGKKVRTKENFFGQYKKPYTVDLISNLRESVGIMKDGTFNTNPRNIKEGKEIVKKGVGEEIKGLLGLTNKIITNQSVRELLDAEGRVFESTMLKLADGKPEKAFSKVKEVKGLETAIKEAAVERNINLDIKEIGKRVRKGEVFDFKMLEDMFGKENPAIRQVMENALIEARGLELVTKVTKLQSIKDFYETSKEADRYAKEQAESAKQLANKYGLNAENVSLTNVNNSLDLIQQRKDHNVLVLNNLPFHYKHMPKNALAALLTTYGWNSRARREIINQGKSINKTIISKDAKENSTASLDSYFGKERIIDKGSKYDGRYDECFVPSNFGNLKRQIGAESKRLKRLVDKGKLEQSKADMTLVDFVRAKFSYNNKSSGYEATVRANERLAKDFLTARKKAFDIETRDLGGQIALENVMVHNAMQSEHSTGIEKAMNYNLEHIAWEGSKPGAYMFENKKGILKEYKTKDELHWEHERQLLNNNEHQMQLFVENKAKFDKKTGEPVVSEQFSKDMNVFIETSTQSLVPKTLQLKNDAKGRTSYSELYAPHGKANLSTNAILNVLTRKGAEANQIYISGPNKGKRVGDVLTSEYTLEQMKEVLEKLPKELWGPEAYIIDATNVKKHNEFIDKGSKLLESQLGPQYSTSKSYSKISKRDINKDLSTIKAALELGRETKKEARGMSAWDFDDTLATTKSGVRATIPNPSGKPKPSRKVIFLAGGAGSGKSNVVKKLNLEKQGFKIVNQDISLEWLKKNHGLPENMNDLTKEQRSTLGKLSYQARAIAKRKMMKFQGNAEGVVVDGTGGSMKAMEALVKEFKDKGYDVSMMFVETSLKTALERNRARKERSLLDKIVERNHEAVQGNKSGFKTMFGDRFMEVKTDNLTQESPMPKELVEKMNDFISGYEKIRLDAEQFATDGQKILEQGGKFDFSEFNVVTEGAKGPFFQKAMDRAKKFGTKDTYVLTARPAASARPIYEFLKSQGLEIPLENITGLGNSTGEAKAMWMLEKFAEGYNDMYFADDAMQNVKAVKNVLDQLDIKSKVQLARSGYVKPSGKTKREKSIEDVKDVNKLGSEDSYRDIKNSKVHRVEYEKTVSKNRPDLVKDGIVSENVNRMFDLVDNINIPVNKKRKYEQIMIKWLATSKMRLPEDNYKLKDAVELAERYKEDVFSYKNPNQIIEKYAGKSKEKPTDPNTVKEFAKGTVTNKKHGVTEHVVENTKEGQLAVRKVMDTHFGEKSNPWCLAQKKDGKLTKESWDRWEYYSDGPKSLVFQNGKLIAFKANDQYWDRMDNATDAPVITIKEGRVTKKVELVPIGEGKVQEFVTEKRTVNKSKNTVTTEYATETKDYEAGSVVVENRVNGATVKKTTSRPTFDAQGKDIMQVVEVVNFDKKGKATSNKNFEDGRLIAVNVYGRPFGEMMPKQIVKEKGDQIERMDLDASGKGTYFVESLIGNKIAEIGFQTNTKLENLIKTSPEGKIRLDLEKVVKADPNARAMIAGVRPTTLAEMIGVPGERMFSKVDIGKEFNKIIEESIGLKSFKKFSEGKAQELGKTKDWWNKLKPWNWLFNNSSMEDFSGLVTYAFAGKGKKGVQHKEFFKKYLEKPFNRAYNETHIVRQSLSNNYKELRKSMPEVTKQLNEKVGGTVYTVENAIRTYLWTKAGYEVPGMSKRDLKTLNEFVLNNERLVAFAESLSRITNLKEGYEKPREYWLGENISADLQKLSDGYYRDKHLAEFKENRKAIFGEWKGSRLIGENMNKIEAIKGTKWRENIESMLWAMETGQNRGFGSDRITSAWMNWVNRSAGAVMFFNVKSAALQTISSLNYMNGTFNNPFRAAQAFANQPQYWKDFVKIFNSDMLLQRRAGLKINVEASELLSALDGKSNKAERALAYLLEKGFLPTKYADSFAIASGGAAYYRNSIKKYKRQGMSDKQAEAKAWEDFMEITEATQQSSRPDFISAYQRSAIGRPILMFANTPMQMFRRHKRRVQDIAKRRGNTAENLLSALYYGFAQTALFSFMANAMFAVDEDDKEKEESGYNERQNARFVETIVDSYLRGTGTPGAIISSAKNAIIEFEKQNKKDWNADYDEVIYDLLSVSPAIGSKIRKVRGGLKDWEYNKDVISEMGLHLDNPINSMTADILSGLFNIPADRLLLKIQNLRDASNSDYEVWERIALASGLNRWNLGLGKIESVEEAKERIKQKKKEEKVKEKEEKEKIKLREKYPDKTDEQIDEAVIVEEKTKQVFDLNKREQVKILEANGLNPKDYPKEADRVDAILKLREKDEFSIDSTLTAIENYVPSESEQRSIDLFKMNKKDQVNMLIDLGLSSKQIKKLKYEEDRVNKIIELENKKKSK